MFDTNLTVVGTALNTPEKRITKNDALVATFRVASRARRFDRDAGGGIRFTCDVEGKPVLAGQMTCSAPQKAK